MLLLGSCKEPTVASHLEDFEIPTTTVVKDSCTSQLYKDTFSIAYGTSYGMCVSHCDNEWTFTSHCLKHKKSGSMRTQPTTPTTITSDHLPINEWNEIIAGLDLQKFYLLDERIGCPDCNDGGAAWVEINNNGRIKQVMFEVGNPPEAIETLVEKLRSLSKE